MVRTAGTAIKITGGKSTKSVAASGGLSYGAGGSGARKSVGGNKLVQRPIPKWQKPIGSFFKKPGLKMDSNVNQVNDYTYKSDLATLITDMVDTGLSDTSSTAANPSMTSLLDIEDDDYPELPADDVPEGEPNEPSDKENKPPAETPPVESSSCEASTSSRPDSPPILLKRKFPPEIPAPALPQPTRKRQRTAPDFILLEQFENENCKIAPNIVL